MSLAGCSSRYSLTTARLLLLGAVLQCTCIGGCVSGSRRTMTQFLPSVPQTWWPRTREDAGEETKPAEPSVTANVAVIADSSEVASDRSKTPIAEPPASPKRERGGRGSPPKDSVATQTSGHAVPPPFTNDHRASAREMADLSARSQTGKDTGQEQVERLKAALNEDARRSAEPNRAAVASGDVRLRVDSLLGRARRLFDVGQFNEARQTAQIAQELGESVRLDYSPDEDRPIDLVHRIDDQLQAMQDSSDKTNNTDNNDVATSEDSTTEGRPDSESKSAAVEPSGNRSWLLGRSMNVFRRERKTASAESTVIPASSETEAARVSLSLELDDDAKPNADSRTAVVQANRSVALSANNAWRSNDRRAGQAQTLDHDKGGNASHSSEPANEAAADMPEDSERHLVAESPDSPLDSSAGLSPDNHAQLTVEDTESTPPALEDVRPVSPFRNVASQIKGSHPRSPERAQSRSSIWGWSIGALCLLVCSVLALACYRRGAT